VLQQTEALIELLTSPDGFAIWPNNRLTGQGIVSRTYGSKG
jgi:hypothetical protein